MYFVPDESYGELIEEKIQAMLADLYEEKKEWSGTELLAMVVIMYGNNIYHGKKIVRLASEGKLDEVKKVRKITHKISALTLALMILITVEAVGLQFLG